MKMETEYRAFKNEYGIIEVYSSDKIKKISHIGESYLLEVETDGSWALWEGQDRFGLHIVTNAEEVLRSMADDTESPIVSVVSTILAWGEEIPGFVKWNGHNTVLYSFTDMDEVKISGDIADEIVTAKCNTEKSFRVMTSGKMVSLDGEQYEICEMLFEGSHATNYLYPVQDAENP